MDAFYVPGTVLCDFPAFFDFAGVEIEKPRAYEHKAPGQFPVILGSAWLPSAFLAFIRSAPPNAISALTLLLQGP